jgi:ribosomal protein L15E
VFVEAHVDGSPRTVNRAAVSAVLEEWRVVDRWWTEEPVSRRYFDVVLAGGEHAVVFRDEEVGRWFSQRGNDGLRGGGRRSRRAERGG